MVSLDVWFDSYRNKKSEIRNELWPMILTVLVKYYHENL